jgi:HlyD family secretion protein
VRLLSLKLPQYLLLTTVLGATTCSGYLAYERITPRTAAAAQVTTAQVSRGSIEATVSASGSVASPTQSKLSFKHGGRLTALLVDVGNTVEAGQALARIDDAELLAALQHAQASYTSAVAKLEQTRAGMRPEELAAALASVEQARLKLEQTRSVASGPDAVTARSQVEQARLKLEQLQHPRQEDVAAAQARLDSARAKLEALRTPRPEDLAAAQSALDQARTKLAQLQDQPKTATPQDVANAELAVQSAQVEYDKALADAANAARPGSGLSQAAADASIKRALIGLQTAQNDLSKIKAQGPSEWEVRLQQVAVAQAEASLLLLKHPAPADVAAAQAAVVQAQAELDKLLHPSPYDLRAAQEGLTQAQANLQKLLTNNRYDVQAALAALNQAQANYALKAAGPTAADIAVAQAAVDQAQAQLKQAEINLSGAVLTAPYAGVVAALGANRGEHVGPGTAVVTLVDTSRTRVDVVVDEPDVAEVQPGQPVTLTLDALPGRRIAGQVAVVAPVASVHNGVVNYTVQLQLDPSQAAGIRPGMTATAAIVTTRKEDVVLVPSRALRTQGQGRTVEVLAADGQTTTTRQVQVGVTSDQMTEIVGGLQPGDRVILPTTTAGARVPGLVPAGAATRR